MKEGARKEGEAHIVPLRRHPASEEQRLGVIVLVAHREHGGTGAGGVGAVSSREVKTERERERG
jgi:hypothetical protein